MPTAVLPARLHALVEAVLALSLAVALAFAGVRSASTVPPRRLG